MIISNLDIKQPWIYDGTMNKWFHAIKASNISNISRSIFNHVNHYTCRVTYKDNTYFFFKNDNVVDSKCILFLPPTFDHTKWCFLHKNCAKNEPPQILKGYVIFL